MISAALRLTDTAIEYGFTKLSFNEDFLVYLVHVFAEYIKDEPYFDKNLPIGHFFITISNSNKKSKSREKILYNIY